MKVLTQGCPSEIIKHVLPLYEWKGTILRMNIVGQNNESYVKDSSTKPNHWVCTRVLQLLN